jgi:hypothetical protein
MTVKTHFEGDIFEMEDHRQWTDASFKTYNRPIDLPLPYTLEPETPVKQSVTITATGSGDGALPESAIDVPEIDGQTLPFYALPLDSPSAAQSALDHIEPIKALKPARLLMRHDGTRDKGADLSPLARLATETGAAIELQAILGAESDDAVSDEVKALARDCSAAGLAVARIAALPKVDEASFRPCTPGTRLRTGNCKGAVAAFSRRCAHWRYACILHRIQPQASRPEILGWSDLCNVPDRSCG